MSAGSLQDPRTTGPCMFGTKCALVGSEMVTCSDWKQLFHICALCKHVVLLDRAGQDPLHAHSKTISCTSSCGCKMLKPRKAKTKSQKVIQNVARAEKSDDVDASGELPQEKTVRLFAFVLTSEVVIT